MAFAADEKTFDSPPDFSNCLVDAELLPFASKYADSCQDEVPLGTVKRIDPYLDNYAYFNTKDWKLQEKL